MDIVTFDYMLLWRLVTAVILGGIIGFERGGTNHDAGFRTHIVLCLGAATVMVVSECIAEHYGSGDIMRMGAQVISGVGFLGAGSIVMDGSRLRGITTAAGLWTTACVGLAVGSGYYIVAIAVVVLMMFAMLGLRSVARKLRHHRKTVCIKVELNSLTQTREIISELIKEGIHISAVRFEEYDNKIEMRMDTQISAELTSDAVFAALSGFKGITEIAEL